MGEASFLYFTGMVSDVLLGNQRSMFTLFVGVVFYLYLFGISVINLIVIVAAPVSQNVSHPIKIILKSGRSCSDRKSVV